MNRRQFLAGTAACAIVRPSLAVAKPLTIQLTARVSPDFTEFAETMLKRIAEAYAIPVERLKDEWPPRVYHRPRKQTGSSSMLAIAGEQIEAGMAVMMADADGKLYAARPGAGQHVGYATERIRMGFQVRVEGGTAREDDA